MTAPLGRRSVVDSPDVFRSHLRQLPDTISNATRPTLAVLAAPRLPSSSPARRRLPSARCRTGSRTRSSRTSRARPSLAFTPDGRLLVTTQFGEVRLIDGGHTLARPGARPRRRRSAPPTRWGCSAPRSIPGSPANGFVYLYYTRSKSGSCVNRVSRFTMSGATIGTGERARADRQDPGDAATTTPATSSSATTATSTSASATAAATTPATAAAPGRTTPRATSTCSSGRSCASRGPAASRRRIPSRAPAPRAATSPGSTTAGNKCQETFAWGLRNPFRFAFDPNAAGTRFFINDVGQDVWEEIDLGQAGADYGWNVREGPCANGSATNCGPPPAGMTNPIYDYSHARTGCAAITGGAFVPNGALAARVRRRVPLRRLHVRQDLPARRRTAAAASRAPSSRPASARSST